MLSLPIVLRDFQTSHPDMQWHNGSETGIVEDALGPDRKPVYAHGANSTATVNNETTFNQWYRDVSGVNQTTLQTLVFNQLGTGEYQYDNSSFFPIDGQLFGNEGNSHNFHFTSRGSLLVRVQGGQAAGVYG